MCPYVAMFANLCKKHTNMWKEVEKIYPFCLLNNIGNVFGESKYKDGTHE